MKNSQSDPISLGTRTNIQGEKKKCNQVTMLGKGVFQHSAGVHLQNKICQRGGKWLSGALKNTMLRKRMDNRMERNCCDSINESLELVYNIIKINKGSF